MSKSDKSARRFWFSRFGITLWLELCTLSRQLGWCFVTLRSYTFYLITETIDLSLDKFDFRLAILPRVPRSVFGLSWPKGHVWVSHVDKSASFNFRQKCCWVNLEWLASSRVRLKRYRHWWGTCRGATRAVVFHRLSPFHLWPVGKEPSVCLIHSGARAKRILYS